MFKIKLMGLNELGSNEIKKYYEPNINKHGESAVLEKTNVGENPLKIKTKIVKREPNDETNIGVYDCCLYIPDLMGNGPKLSLQLKYFNYEIETYSL
jgi:hypothetical protein